MIDPIPASRIPVYLNNIIIYCKLFVTQYDYVNCKQSGTNKYERRKISL